MIQTTTAERRIPLARSNSGKRGIEMQTNFTHKRAGRGSPVRATLRDHKKNKRFLLCDTHGHDRKPPADPTSTCTTAAFRAGTSRVFWEPLFGNRRSKPNKSEIRRSFNPSQQPVTTRADTVWVATIHSRATGFLPSLNQSGGV